MAQEEKKGTPTGPLFAALALAGIAGVAYIAYRRLADKGEQEVTNLMHMADRASRILEKRIDDFALVSS